MPNKKRFTTKIGDYHIVVHESSDAQGVIIDKYLEGDLVDTQTIWYSDLVGG